MIYKAPLYEVYVTEDVLWCMVEAGVMHVRNFIQVKHTLIQCAIFVNATFHSH